MTIEFKIKPLVAALIAASVLTACGGGGGDGGGTDTLNPGGGTNQPAPNNPGDTGGNNPPPDTNNPPPGDSNQASRMTMVCPEGGEVQCSGENIIATENGVILTNSGVQVIGRSTSDIDPATNTTPTTATGLGLTTDGLAEIRMNKAGDATSGAAPLMLLSDLGISWDGTNERPRIIESFLTRQGRVELVNNLLDVKALPASSDTSFYNFATLRTNATQANYANNVYYPRCADGSTTCANPETETTGVQQRAGTWRTGGADPDWVGASRLHNDGDVHAGDGVEAGTPGGVPFPGSKGYRSFDTWAFAHANLTSWASQDTVQMAEWTGGDGNAEHNTLRRGVVAYGDVTPPAQVPKTGSASYSGIFYGWYGTNPAGQPDVFRGVATVTVDFATRNVNIAFSDVNMYDASGQPLPLAFETTATMGAADTSRANYMTGPITGAFTGGLSARYFGEVVSTGSSGAGPAEIGGALRFTTTTGGTVIGGFIGRKN